MEHLAERIRPLLSCSDQIRIQYCDDSIWIRTSIAKSVIDDATRMVSMSRNETVRCKALVGNSGIGKTTILQKLMQKLNSKAADTVLYVDLSSFGNKLDLRALFISMLGLHIPPRLIDTADAIKLMQARLKELGTKMVIFDEAGAILDSRLKVQNCNFIRALSNQTFGINVILAGVPDLINLVLSIKDLKTRFGLWEMEDWGAMSASLSMFLKGYARQLPLRMTSVLHDEEMQAQIVKIAGTLTRDIVRVLRAAAIYAIVHKYERIDLEVLALSHAATFAKHEIG
jgi:hypothetical protein